MALFRKKADPISDRARALNSEIAALEAQIRKFESRLGQPSTDPDHSASPFASKTSVRSGEPPDRPIKPRPEPELAEVAPRPLISETELEREAVHLNELGVQKFDLPGLLTKVRRFFKAPTTSNPKLVSYLAAGGIQGLRPLRYEKRVARNRFIVFVVILFLLLLGMLTVFVPR